MRWGVFCIVDDKASAYLKARLVLNDALAVFDKQEEAEAEAAAMQATLGANQRGKLQYVVRRVS